MDDTSFTDAWQAAFKQTSRRPDEHRDRPDIALTDLTGTYTLDPAHTRIGFVARHAMVTKVRGAFNEFEGTATLDGANPANSRVQVTIDAASIDTRNAQRDEHLRGNDFLSMQEYPQITFSSTGVRRSTTPRSRSPAT